MEAVTLFLVRHLMASYTFKQNRQKVREFLAKKHSNIYYVNSKYRTNNRSKS